MLVRLPLAIATLVAITLASLTTPTTFAADGNLETVVKIVIETEKQKPAADAAAADDDGSGKRPFVGKRPAVDVALLLDTSNSMDGLIDQAKSQLWKIVNRFSDAKRDGRTPVLRVALFEYGNTRLPATEGYLRQVVPLTDDLDKVSEALFALKTSGGDEYCGQVIDEALTRLAWSEEPGSYQAIFIAGNEPFTQGSVDYRKSCKRAIEKGVVVNTIHCGSYSNGVSGQWAHGAELAEGTYLNIDQDQKAERIVTPHDTVLIRLSSELNKTYLWYGARAEDLRRNQAAQDSNAREMAPAAAAQRAATKASGNYNYRGRDLVDSFNADAASLAKIAADKLPQDLRGLSGEALRSKVKEMAARRVALQKQIAEQNVQREAFIVEARKKAAGADGKKTLGEAIVNAIDKQLVKAGYEVKK